MASAVGYSLVQHAQPEASQEVDMTTHATEPASEKTSSNARSVTVVRVVPDLEQFPVRRASRTGDRDWSTIHAESPVP